MSKIVLKQSPKLFAFLSKKSGADGYAAHQLLWGLFPNTGKKTRDFLYYKQEGGRTPFFLIISHDRPVKNDALEVYTKEYLPKLKEGDKLAFSLRANPVISRKENGKSVRHNVLVNAKQRLRGQDLSYGEIFDASQIVAKKWLILQGERTGFSCSLDSITVNGYKKHSFYKKKSNMPIKFSSIDYEGILSVTDPEKFVEMLKSGLGKSKAFGCGLMLVRRV